MSSEPREPQDGLRETEPAQAPPIVVEVEGRRVPDGIAVSRRYELRPASRLNLLGVFREIYFRHDATFGFRNFECGRGICSTCNVMVNGRLQKACRLRIPAGTSVRVAAQSDDRLLRDVACSIATGDDDGNDDD